MMYPFDITAKLTRIKLQRNREVFEFNPDFGNRGKNQTRLNIFLCRNWGGFGRVLTGSGHVGMPVFNKQNDIE